jgi:hypothetical protein
MNSTTRTLTAAVALCLASQVAQSANYAVLVGAGTYQMTNLSLEGLDPNTGGFGLDADTGAIVPTDIRISRDKGHTDLTPYRGKSKEESARLNMELSLRRARRVVETLVEEFDVPRDRLEAQGLGQTVPLMDEDSEEAGRLNRRVELKVLGPS